MNVSSGTPWETAVAYSRAVRKGPFVAVSGTTASDANGDVQCPGDAYGQTVYILKKIEAALTDCGASLSDVVRTRMFVTDVSCWQEVGRAHQEFFADICPASTLIEVSRLVDDGLLVEIEVDAVVDE